MKTIPLLTNKVLLYNEDKNNNNNTNILITATIAPSILNPKPQPTQTQSVQTTQLPSLTPQLTEVFAKKNRLMNALTPKPIEGIENWGIPDEPQQPCDPERAVKSHSSQTYSLVYSSIS